MLKSSKINTTDYIKNDRVNLIALIIMYTGFWTLIVDSTIISQTTLSLFQAATLFFGVYHFSFALIKNMNLQFNGFYLKKPLSNTGLLTFIVWLEFGLSVILSELIRGASPHVGVMYFIYIPIFFFYIIPRTLHNPIKTTLKAVLFSGLIIISLSLLWELPTIGNSYTGITNNPNSMGMVANQTALSSLCLFYMDFLKRKSNKKNIILYGILLTVAILFLIVSESRTSLLVVATGMLIIFMHGIISRNIKLHHLFILLILFLFVYQFFLRDFFVEGIFEKITAFSSSGNLLAGRSRIWGNVITDVSLFGYGFEYFSEYLQIQAHNDILQFTGMYGVLTGVLLAIFLGFTVILSIQYLIKNINKTNAIIPLVFVTAYIVLGMAETVLGFNAKTPTMVYYNIVGILLLYL